METGRGQVFMGGVALMANGSIGLHGAAFFFGTVELVVALLAMKGWDINAKDSMGRTLLSWAAVRGHEDVVKILLQHKDY